MKVTSQNGTKITLPDVKVGDSMKAFCPKYRAVTLTVEATKIAFDSNGMGATLKIRGKCKCGEYHVQDFHRYSDADEAEYAKTTPTNAAMKIMNAPDETDPQRDDTL